MRKFMYLGAVVLAMASCKPTMNTKSQVGLKGTWTLTNISHIGGEFVKVSSFNIADSKCFIGSQWKFVSNNNTGSVNLTSRSGDCPTFDSDFKWVVTPAGQFEFKFVDEGVKAKKVTTGYSLRVKNQSTDTFELVDKFYAGGQTYDVTYHFTRN